MAQKCNLSVRLCIPLEVKFVAATCLYRWKWHKCCVLRWRLRHFKFIPSGARNGGTIQEAKLIIMNNSPKRSMVVRLCSLKGMPVIHYAVYIIIICIYSSPAHAAVGSNGAGIMCFCVHQTCSACPFYSPQAEQFLCESADFVHYSLLWQRKEVAVNQFKWSKQRVAIIQKAVVAMTYINVINILFRSIQYSMIIL